MNKKYLVKVTTILDTQTVFKFKVKRQAEHFASNMSKQEGIIAVMLYLQNNHQ